MPRPLAVLRLAHLRLLLPEPVAVDGEDGTPRDALLLRDQVERPRAGLLLPALLRDQRVALPPGRRQQVSPLRLEEVIPQLDQARGEAALVEGLDWLVNELVGKDAFQLAGLQGPGRGDLRVGVGLLEVRQGGPRSAGARRGPRQRTRPPRRGAPA